MICGPALGTWIGGRFFVAPGSGLAGPAIAFGYGLIGAFVGGVLAVLAARLLPRPGLEAIAASLALGAAVVVVLITRGYLAARSEQHAHLYQLRASLPPFKLSVHYAEDAPDRRFVSIQVDTGPGVYNVEKLDGAHASAGHPAARSRAHPRTTRWHERAPFGLTRIRRR